VSRVAAILAAHPRHVFLGALVAGLLLGPRTGTALVLALAVVLALVARAGGGRPVMVWGLAAVLCVGAMVGTTRVRALEHTALAPLIAHVVRGEVTVTQAPRTQDHGGWTALADFRGEPVLLRAHGPSPFTPVSARAARPPPLPDVGARLRVRAAVGAPDRYARILKAHVVLRLLDVHATGRVRGGLAGAVDAVRRRAQRALHRGPAPVRSALLQGMVLGQDAGLPTPARDDMRASGLSHLTAASGQNIVLLVTMALAVCGLVGVPFRARWLLVLTLIAVYVPLAGGGPSIQRAGIMGAAGVVAVLAGRPAARWYAVGLAALVTLTLDPRAASEPGWQLSFVAVIALLALARPWAARLHGRGIPGPVAEALAVTGAATLATAPVIAAHFGTAAPLSVPANLVVAPVVAPIMWLGFTAAVAGQAVPALSAVLDQLADPLLWWVLAVARTAAAGPGAGLHAGTLSVLAVVVCVLAALGVEGAVRIRGPGGRRVALTLPALLLGATAVAGAWAARPPRSPAPPAPAGLRVTFLDVGQGDATLLEVPGHVVLVDTGPPDSPLLARLDRAGVRRLDVLVVTHAQADHDGGAADVLAAMPVGLVVDGRDGVRSGPGARFAAAAHARGARLVPGRAGLVFRAGTLTVRVLSPGDGPTSGQTGDDPNNRAVVLEASVGQARVLLTADAESDVLARLDLERVDVLKVPHHGSADPGLPSLLERLQPLIAGIEVGARNAYGPPAGATLRALRAGPRVVRTDRDGSVRADLGPRGWTVHRDAEP
jgi:competence protein ComEC